MAKPNYQFEKRRREMDKKRKKEEKRLRKLAGHPDPSDEAADNPAPEAGEETQPENTL